MAIKTISIYLAEASHAIPRVQSTVHFFFFFVFFFLVYTQVTGIETVGSYFLHALGSVVPHYSMDHTRLRLTQANHK